MIPYHFGKVSFRFEKAVSKKSYNPYSSILR